MACSTSFAQRERAAGVETDIELLRRDLRSEKKKLIALNVPLTAEEATGFWPVYDQYIADITKVCDQFYQLVKDYAGVEKTITDEQASKMMKRYGELMVQVHPTRQRYIPIVEKVIPARKAAHFFQIDRRLYALLELQVASQTPLVLQ